MSALSLSLSLATVIGSASFAAAHQTIWHPSIFGFNESTAPNRPQDPLIQLPFSQWWFHGFLSSPPNDGDYMDLPAGGTIHSEIACDKGYTSWYNTSAGGDTRSQDQPDYPCPGQPLSQFHTTGINDLGGCALAIAYNSDANSVKPEDFAVFSANQTCPWYLHTDFQVPAAMPECPDGGCTCAWFWLHTPDSGAEQMYMTGFRCKVSGASATEAIGTPQLARRCGADPANGINDANPGNCTYGAKQPFYWYQAEGNTFFEGTYAPPLYTDLYNFKDGAQNDIFGESAVETTGWVSATANAKRAPEPTPAAGPRRLLSRHAKKQGHGVF
ncbi:uncharacterized protein STEHIDRAFT_152641 [Stereum hirsutum FP-91666 SS1]|uniref:uncharacterized protein n=1 Tax=Stereum hirsutum (strain FP-91666) TaxID=721885 RepID=UPI000440EA04|nr:uncharacterized protein STEHIDRAFT_152641 [Stereum hirsutum FP-91666 SS1]EIM90957.1 hypothetical protein STEHIDRAFT_152641 [Stereum hirsutum FP-91666 SS1]